MEIIKTNFYENIDEIYKILDECEFIAIDAEMTGLPDTFDYSSRGESIDVRYSRLKKESKCFMINQFGFCPVKFDDIKKTYIASPFNVYIYPRQSSNVTSDSHFMCSGTSLEFLSEHNFDFNKWIKEGVPYMREREEKIAFEKIEKEICFIKNNIENNQSNDINVISTVPSDIQQNIDNAMSQITELIERKNFDTVDIQAADDRFRKYLLISINIQFSNKVFAETYNDNDFKYVRIKPLISENRIIELQQNQKRLAGFSAVIRKIFTLKKPIIGHNIYLDLLMTCRQFYRELPKSLAVFKTFINELAPIIYDTKLMANSGESLYRGSTILDDLYNGLLNFEFCKKNPIKMSSKFTRYSSDSGFSHEAGYDAYITACCFVWLSHSLDSTIANQINYYSPALMQLKNKIHLTNVSEGKIIDLRPAKVRSSDTRVVIGFYDTPQNQNVKFDQLIGYSFIWKTNLIVFIIGSYKISKCELQRLKSIMKCNTIRTFKEWKKKENIPIELNDNPIIAVSKYVNDLSQS